MNRLRKVLLSLVVVGATGVVAGAGVWSAFSATTSSPGNTFSAGTVAISDNDLDGVLLSLSNAIPGATSTGCIKVKYDGTVDSQVRLYGNPSGALGQYLTLKVTRGTDSNPAFRSCDNFTPDNRNYIGQGLGVVYNGNLSAYPASYTSGIDDPDSSTGLSETWSPAEVHSYKLEVTLQDNLAAQGQSASASFTWEARNK